jgi:hypothetical protein
VVKTANGVTVELQIDPSKLTAGEKPTSVHFATKVGNDENLQLSRCLRPRHVLNEDMTEHVHAHGEQLEGTSITSGGGRT